MGCLNIDTPFPLHIMPILNFKYVYTMYIFAVLILYFLHAFVIIAVIFLSAGRQKAENDPRSLVLH